MESVKITLNLERLVERSSGVFGKSGTGKTFLIAAAAGRHHPATTWRST